VGTSGRSIACRVKFQAGFALRSRPTGVPVQPLDRFRRRGNAFEQPRASAVGFDRENC
jgi:hypothetical protein